MLRSRRQPPRSRLAPPWLRARSEAKRRRNPILRLLGDADQALLRAMRTRGHQQPVELTMRALGAIGEFGAVWIAIGAGGALADAQRRRRWAVAAGIAPAAIGMNYAVKLAIGRERPLIEGHPALARAPSKLSFPSAHATSSLAAAAALGRVEPRGRPPLYALAVAICLSRPYLGMHYPSDVLAGAALGTALGALTPGVGGRGTEDRLIDLVNQSHASPPAAGNGRPATESTAPGQRPAA